MKTHCKHGHEFTTTNTYIRKENKSKVCRECMRIRVRKYDRNQRVRGSIAL